MTNSQKGDDMDLSKLTDIDWISNVSRNLATAVDHKYMNFRHRHLGQEFMSSNWDVLVILDACRPEMLFQHDLPAEDRQTRYSAASESWGFMQANFGGRTLHDTVYVTANPHAHKLNADIFHDIDTMDDAWDDSLGTVPPERVTDHAHAAQANYPNKRLIIHYMQPHFPFIGNLGQDIDVSAIDTEMTSDRPGNSNPWTRLKNGDIPLDAVIDAYEENHELIAAEMFDLIDNLSGKIVMTADHANLVGDRGFPIPIRLFGHPADFSHPKLRRVPWIEIPADERPNTVAEEPFSDKSDTEDVAVGERLESLGYK